MRYLSFVLILFFHTFASAMVVKITDHADGVGSGWLIRTSKGAYVLTSEHVLTYRTPNVHIGARSIPARSVFRDWARGFAVLKPTAPIEEGTEVSDAELLETLTIHERDQVELKGFPAATTDNPISASGEIASTESCRWFISAGCGIEVIKTHGEAGMSGGPVLLNNQLIGLISHQVLHVEPGKPSEVRVMVKNSGLASHIFILPRGPIYQVIAGLIGLKPEVLPIAVRVFDTYDIREERLLVDGWLFSPKQGSNRITVASIGGDGVGIGAHHRPLPSVSSMTVSLRKADGHAMEEWHKGEVKTTPILANFPHVVESWNKALRQPDARPGSRQISSFLDLSRGKGDLRSVHFSTIEEFVRLLMKSDHIPIWRMVSESNKENPERAKARQEALAHLSGLALPIREGSASDDYRKHYARVSALLDASNDLSQWLLEPEAFTQLLDIKGPHFKGWKAFFAQDHYKTVGLLQNLYVLECHYASTCK